MADDKKNKCDLDPNYAPIFYQNLSVPNTFDLPRKYTSTHDDATRQIFLSVGPKYSEQLLSTEEVKNTESQVLGAWHHTRKGYKIILRVLVSTVKNPEAAIRDRIFRAEMNKVLQSIALSEKALLCAYPKLAKTPIYIDFISDVVPSYSGREQW